MSELELRDSLAICVAYLCTRLEEIEEEVYVNHIHITDTGLRNLINVGRDLAAAIEAVGEIMPPQDIVIRFTDSESEPQDMV